MKPLAILLAVLVAAPMLLAPPVATAADDFKIALVAPLSGRWARQGQLKKMGAEMAIAEINAQGGIKALGGAKIVLREADAGDSVEKAVSAAQRVLAREKLLKAKGIEIVVDEIWTPPLADATAIVQKVRSTQPDIVFYGATNFPDSIQVLQKVKEFGLNVPIQGVGAWLVTPEYVKTVGKELLDNIMTVTAAHPLKGQEELVKRFTERTGEPFMTQDPLMTYAHVWIIKEAAEMAKSADPKAIRDAVAKLDLKSGPAASTLAPGRIKYDERGRRVGAAPIIVPCQNGESFTVVPVVYATKKPIWNGAK